jgi:hypothetical protein
MKDFRDPQTQDGIASATADSHADSHAVRVDDSREFQRAVAHHCCAKVVEIDRLRDKRVVRKTVHCGAVGKSFQVSRTNTDTV